MLREYETVFVLHPDLTDDIVTSTVDRLKEVITKMGGEILNEDHWGKKKLAFAVKKHQRGNYVLFH
jgi:small subunit ribosomal protein S6